MSYPKHFWNGTMFGRSVTSCLSVVCPEVLTSNESWRAFRTLKERSKMKPLNFILGWGKNPDELVKVSNKFGACTENIFFSWLIKKRENIKKVWTIFLKCSIRTKSS